MHHAILDRLLNKLSNVRKSGAGHIASCPCTERHNNGDANPSLKINLADDGKILIHCVSQNCRLDDILERLGMQASELFPPSMNQSPGVRTSTTRPKVYASLDTAIRVVARQLSGQCVGRWTYRHRDGKEAFVVARFETRKGKDFRPFHPVEGGFSVGDPPGQLPLYRLSDLADEDLIIIVEGEKCVDTAHLIGLNATTSAHGSDAAAKSDWSFCAGKSVVILPDNDEPGRKYARQVAAILTRLGCKVKILELPDLPAGGDIVEFIDLHKDMTSQELRLHILDLADNAEVWQPPVGGRSSSEGSDDRAVHKKSQADLIVELLDQSAELFHGVGFAGQPFARIHVVDHFETWRIGSKRFGMILRQAFYDEYEKVPRAQVLSDAQNMLAAKALQRGPEIAVSLRFAGHEKKIYIDLCDETWRVVEISSSGWRVLESHEVPVRFIRTRGMLALPKPLSGGSIDELRPFVNLADDRDWVLCVAWLLDAFRPWGPYLILCVNGEQGTAKSTLCRFLRSLVDPNEAPLRRPPANERDLIITAMNSRVIALDNLSGLSPHLSDALCTLATGAGFSTRELYSDGDEFMFNGARPIMLNGIDDLANRPDLLDRSLVVQLPRIVDSARCEEAELCARFEAARPRILGGICDVLCGILRDQASIRLSRLPRMADSARWISAAERALGWIPGTFVETLFSNRNEANELVVEQAPIGLPILALLAKNSGVWESTMAELLDELEKNHTDEKTRKGRYWPKNAHGMASALKRLLPALRAVGVDKTARREYGGIRRRIIRLERIDDPSSPTSQTSQMPPDGTIAERPKGRSGDDQESPSVRYPTPKTDAAGAMHPTRDDWDDRNYTPTTDSSGEANPPDTPPADLVTPAGACSVCGASVVWMRVADGSSDAGSRIVWTVCNPDGQPHQCPRDGPIQSNADDVPF